MYVALYDIDLNHITNLSHAVGTLITKVYDFDEIKLSGKDTLNVDVSKLEKAKVFRLNEDDGKEIYSGFVYKAKKKHNTVEIIGNDFRTLLDTEIIVDYYTQPIPAGFDEFLDILVYLFNNQIDIKAKEIDYEISYVYPDVGFDFQNIFGEIPKEPKIVNFIKFIAPVIKYYEYRIITSFDWVNKKIIFILHGDRENHDIKLEDFEYDLSQNQPSVNKTIAVMKHVQFGYKWVKQEYVSVWENVYPEQTQYSETQPSADEGFQWVQTGNHRTLKEYRKQIRELNPDGTWGDWEDTTTTIWAYTQPNETIDTRWVATGNRNPTEYEWILQEYIQVWQNVIPEEFIWSQTEPEGELQENERWFNTGEILEPIGAVKYYYLTTDNQIVESDQYGDIPNRYYPVKSKIFSDEYLANAQMEAILELANQRYVDSITIDANSPINPIDLSNVALFDLVNVYDSNYQKTLPVAEKQLKIDKSGVSFKLKLGFKKEKLTEIIRAGG